MSVHDSIKEQTTSRIRRRGVCGDNSLGVRILDRVIGGDLRCGVFPDHTVRGRETGERRRPVNSLVDGRLGEQRECAFDHEGLAVWSFLFYIDGKRGSFAALRIPVIYICWRGNDDYSAKDGLPSTPEHAEICGSEWIYAVKLNAYEFENKSRAPVPHHHIQFDSSGGSHSEHKLEGLHVVPMPDEHTTPLSDNKERLGLNAPLNLMSSSVSVLDNVLVQISQPSPTVSRGLISYSMSCFLRNVS